MQTNPPDPESVAAAIRRSVFPIGVLLLNSGSILAAMSGLIARDVPYFIGVVSITIIGALLLFRAALQAKETK